VLKSDHPLLAQPARTEQTEQTVRTVGMRTRLLAMSLLKPMVVIDPPRSETKNMGGLRGCHDSFPPVSCRYNRSRGQRCPFGERQIARTQKGIGFTLKP
jgi:hypothetical protein